MGGVPPPEMAAAMRAMTACLLSDAGASMDCGGVCAGRASRLPLPNDTAAAPRGDTLPTLLAGRAVAGEAGCTAGVGLRVRGGVAGGPAATLGLGATGGAASSCCASAPSSLVLLAAVESAREPGRCAPS